MTKYEIYLPLKYNNGKAIEPDKLLQIRRELSMMFGALTMSPLEAPFKGIWKYGGVEFTDDIFKIEIISDDKRAEEFLKNFKLHLMELLDQLEILITVEDIRTI